MCKRPHAPPAMSIWREKVVVVTGAGSGIGRALALLLGQRGARLVLVGRRRGILAEVAADIEAAGGRAVLTLAGDVRDWGQVTSLRDQVLKHYGGIDVLVNNAGSGAYGLFATADVATYDEMLQTNLHGVIYCARAFLPSMLARGQGRVVFVSSIVGELPSPAHAVYSASKFAVSGLAESLDYELAPQGIAVHLVEPGLVRTEFAARAGIPSKRFEQMPSKLPAEVALSIVRGIEAGQRKIVPDAKANLAIKLRRHFPRLARAIFKRIFREF